jgi:hypothetical protein
MVRGPCHLIIRLSYNSRRVFYKNDFANDFIIQEGMASTCCIGTKMATHYKESAATAKEGKMQPARKLNECACGTQIETSCEGCGAPVCRQCLHQEINSRDLKTIFISTYCQRCKDDPAINSWGTLYWDKLVALYT